MHMPTSATLGELHSTCSPRLSLKKVGEPFFVVVLIVTGRAWVFLPCGDILRVKEIRAPLYVGSENPPSEGLRRLSRRVTQGLPSVA